MSITMEASRCRPCGAPLKDSANCEYCGTPTGIITKTDAQRLLEMMRKIQESIPRDHYHGGYHDQPIYGMSASPMRFAMSAARVRPW